MCKMLRLRRTSAELERRRSRRFEPNLTENARWNSVHLIKEKIQVRYKNPIAFQEVVRRLLSQIKALIVWTVLAVGKKFQS